MTKLKPSLLPTAPRDWLDESGRFKFGKYEGYLAENVAKDDPGYVRWIVDEVEGCSDTDREVLSALLTWKGGQ